MKFTSIVAFSALLSATNVDAQNKGLKDYYSSYFPISVAVAPASLKGDEVNLILQQFNSLTRRMR